MDNSQPNKTDTGMLTNKKTEAASKKTMCVCVCSELRKAGGGRERGKRERHANTLGMRGRQASHPSNRTKWIARRMFSPSALDNREAEGNYIHGMTKTKDVERMCLCVCVYVCAEVMR